jgi:glycosyltransferase involved in cell wall biosynthesis
MPKLGGDLAAEPRLSAIVLAPETPYPLAGGGALRTASLLHYLARGYDVDLLVFRQPGADDPIQVMPPGLVRRIVVLELPANSRSTAGRAFRNAGRLARRVPPLVDRFSGFEVVVEHAVTGRTYDLGIVEHFWCAPYAEQLAPACRRLVLDLHNVESLLHDRCAHAERGPAALAHRIFAGASRELEASWLPRYHQVLATSAEDAAAVARIAPGVPVGVYPNAIPDRPVPDVPKDEAIVFSGNLEYHPNRGAVRFFRREVWPLLRDRFPNLVWRLIGKNPQAVAGLIAGDPRIELRGPVEDAVSEIARGRVAVVPLLAGSGTRLKILEAWAAGLPVVSTTLGAEGLGARDGEHLLIADEPSAFAYTVSRLLSCSDLRGQFATAGRLLLQKEFTWETAWQKLEF